MKHKFRQASPTNWEENKIDSSTIKTEIPDYPGYFVDESGEVFSHKNSEGFIKLKKYLSKNGYYTVTVTDKKGKRKTKGVHQLVANAYLGSCPIGYVTDHIDQNRQNNSRKNLRYITKAENRQNSEWSKIKPYQFIKIRKAIAKGNTTYAAQARKYNVDESTIRMLCGKCRYNGEYHEAVDYTPTNAALDANKKAAIYRALTEGGMSLMGAARHFGVSKAMASKIKKQFSANTKTEKGVGKEEGRGDYRGEG